MPLQAKTNDPSTWSTFEEAKQRHDQGDYAGIGYVFSAGDPFVGIDLDGCRHPGTGEVASWAQEVVDKCGSYTEVSPSGTGVKIFYEGDSPFAGGKNKKLPQFGSEGGKEAGIEIYDRGRYFTVTGQLVPGLPSEIKQCDLGWLKDKFWPEMVKDSTPREQPTTQPATAVSMNVGQEEGVKVRRAIAYMANTPPSISGENDHNALYAIIVAMIHGFLLSAETTKRLIIERFNPRCQPEWGEREIDHKIHDAESKPHDKPKGYLLNDPAHAPVDGSIMPGLEADVVAMIARYKTANKPQATPPAGDKTTETGTQKHDPIQYTRITCAELDAGDYELDYLIEHTLVAGQPCIVAGGKKCLKTSIILDMGISLAMGGFFLGKFKVNRACKVAVMTGESGLATIQETCRRICDAAGYKLADIQNLIFSEDLPRFGQVAHEDALRQWLTENKVEVLVLDPAYLCLPGADAGNLFTQGELLRGMAKVCSDCGCTMILCHHTRKSQANPFSPPELEDIAWAGFQEFARQWILVGRRELYKPGTGKHHLWLSVGGSAGHTSLWALNIEEGSLERDGERYWHVDVMRTDDARQEVQDRREAAKEKKQQEQFERDKRTICDTLIKFPEGETKSVIRDSARIGSSRFAPALAELISGGDIHPCKITKSSRKTPYEGYKLVEDTHP